jgi:hypothetical protein
MHFDLLENGLDQAHRYPIDRGLNRLNFQYAGGADAVED